jgi:hypothetical protein
VSIRPDEERGSLGRVIPLEGPESRAHPVQNGGQTVLEVGREALEQWICTLFAGFAAEVRFAPHARDNARECARGDDEQAEDYLERAGWRTTPIRHLLRARTAALIEQHWGAIEYVARALLKHEELDEVEAEIVCEIARGETTEVDLELYRARRGAAIAVSRTSGPSQHEDGSVTADYSDERERAACGLPPADGGTTQ